MKNPPKISWQGAVTFIKPRIRLTRSFDQRFHNYLGYVLRLSGKIGDESREFLVAIGKGAQAKHSFQMGDVLSGESVPVLDKRMEVAEFYKTSKLKRFKASKPNEQKQPPPFLGVPPALEVYRERGHRRLSVATYDKKCLPCMWGCKMPVEMIIDQWNPSVKKYRFETFCYGPQSCPFYTAGPTRKVPGRKGMSYEEEDWVDEDATAHRGPDD